MRTLDRPKNANLFSFAIRVAPWNRRDERSGTDHREPWTDGFLNIQKPPNSPEAPSPPSPPDHSAGARLGNTAAAGGYQAQLTILLQDTLPGVRDTESERV